MEWEVDRGLQIRIVLAIAFVVLLPFAFVLVLLGLLNTVGVELLGWATGHPWNGRFYVPPALVVGVGLGFLAQYSFAEGVALRSVGARTVGGTGEYADLHARLTRLSSVVDVPVPDLAVARTDVPNAFTVGRRPRRGGNRGVPPGVDELARGTDT